MFQVSAYTISMFDPVETGRTKINYLFSGGTSPFAIWSGITENTKYISVLKQDENNSNAITNLIGIKSAYTNYNLIFNGSNNTINQYKAQTNESGSYNLTNGLNNSIEVEFGGNTSVGSGNTISSSSNSFIQGIKNQIAAVYGGIYATMLSSYNNYFAGAVLSNAFSSSQSQILKSSIVGDSPSGNTIVGINNSMESNGYYLKNSFILNGKNNLIQSNNTSSYDFGGIINGQNNSINITSSINNTYIFGSNITANSKDSSHFENLYVDETLLFRNIKKYISDGGIPNSWEIALDKNYTFHEISVLNGGYNAAVKFPTPDNDIQFLSLIISGTSGLGGYTLSFVDDFTGSFPDFVPATNVSCKEGGVGRFSTSLIDNTSAAYFFIWTKEINKWVMFTSDTDNGAFF